MGPLSWSGQEETVFEQMFNVLRPHRSFKEYVGNKTELGRAVIPAAILAGYTGESFSRKRGRASFIFSSYKSVLDLVLSSSHLDPNIFT